MCLCDSLQERKYAHSTCKGSQCTVLRKNSTICNVQRIRKEAFQLNSDGGSCLARAEIVRASHMEIVLSMRVNRCVHGSLLYFYTCGLCVV
jgi:hypothetical protein